MLKRPFKTSTFKGVCRGKNSKKWSSQIYKKNKKINLGLFTAEIEAAKAYNEAAIKYHGEFARLNIMGGRHDSL
jgi:hypothetical protein